MAPHGLVLLAIVFSLYLFMLSAMGFHTLRHWGVLKSRNGQKDVRLFAAADLDDCWTCKSRFWFQLDAENATKNREQWKSKEVPRQPP
jgi:hypothetical protein